jgi:hypothetical protein
LRRVEQACISPESSSNFMSPATWTPPRPASSNKQGFRKTVWAYGARRP